MKIAIRFGLVTVVCLTIAAPLHVSAQRIPLFQIASEPTTENPSSLAAHWRKTTIVFGSPRDEHLVLHADGTAENWTVTATDRTAPITGHWSVEGKTLKLVFGENENARPFTFYEGQLVFPNIPNRRGFWEKIE
jgi:hypothetical protein